MRPKIPAPLKAGLLSLFVIAAIIVNFVVHKFEIESIIQSDFALKEGVAIEWKRAHNL